MQKFDKKTIQDKISKLQEIYQDDIGASYKEASQTEDMIKLYQKILDTEIIPNSNKKVKFILKTNDLEVEYTVQEHSPNPREKIVTRHSEIGKLLIKSKIGDKIEINKVIYNIHSIQVL